MYGIQIEYFNLIAVKDGPEFTAEKISAQDINKKNSKTPDQIQKEEIELDDGTTIYRYFVDVEDIVIYRSVYVPENNDYEDFMVDGEGNLIPVYDKGNTISGSSNSPFWTVRIYYDGDGEDAQPTKYYEIQNQSTGKFLDPRPNDMVVSEDAYIGLVMPEKDPVIEPKTTTRIEAWHDEKKFYYGLYLRDVNGNIELHTGTELDGQSQEFSFAKQYVKDPEQLHEVDTVDSSGIIKIQMYDFYEQGTATDAAGKEHIGIANVLGGDTYIGGNHYNDSGNASMTLNADGWPTFYDTGKTADELYSSENYVGDANHLFLDSVYTSTGFYEYSAFDHYAYYDYDKNAEGKTTFDFKVYEEIGSPNDDNTHYFYKRGNFFPYNPIVPGETLNANSNQFDGNGNMLDYSDPRYGEELYTTQYNENWDYTNHPMPPATFGDTRTNYWFGMTMDFDFLMPKDGQWRDGDMIYEFNGDDDLFIYIDGVKILDIGGNHDALPGTINFADGTITYGTNFYTDNSSIVDGKKVTELVPTTIVGCFWQAQKFPDGSDWTNWNDPKAKQFFNMPADSTAENPKGTFADYTGHSFKMIYAEHGAHASNLYMRFNIPAVNEGSFTVKKELDEKMKDVFGDREFEYMAFVSGRSSHPIVYHNGEGPIEGYEAIPWVQDEEGNWKPQYDEGDTAYNNYVVRRAEKITRDGVRVPLEIDENGIFKLKAGEQAQISLASNDEKYDVVEVNIPVDVQKTYVNETLASPINENWEPNADRYKNEEGINLPELVPDYNDKYAPAGESTPKKRAITTFTNEMFDCPLEIEKEVPYGDVTENDIFRFRVWLENQDGTITPASLVYYDLYEKKWDEEDPTVFTWEKVRPEPYQTGMTGTIEMGAEQKAVITGLLRGTKYVVIEDQMPEGYANVDIKSHENGTFTWTDFTDKADVNGWNMYGTYEDERGIRRSYPYTWGTVEKVITKEGDPDYGKFDPTKKENTIVLCNNRNAVAIKLYKVDSSQKNKPETIPNPDYDPDDPDSKVPKEIVNPEILIEGAHFQVSVRVPLYEVLNPDGTPTGEYSEEQSEYYTPPGSVKRDPTKQPIAMYKWKLVPDTDGSYDRTVPLNGLDIKARSGVYKIEETQTPDGFLIMGGGVIYVEVSSTKSWEVVDPETGGYIPIIDPETGEQAIDPVTGEPLWVTAHIRPVKPTLDLNNPNPPYDPTVKEDLDILKEIGKFWKGIDTGEKDSADAPKLALFVNNTPGELLPVTGGPGTIAYTISGMMLIMIAAAYAFSVRRRERRLKE